MTAALVLAAPVVAIVLVTLFDVVFRRTFRRLAFRNIARRKGEALLVVLGSLLGTAIICASFVVGDTLDASIRDLARTQYGPVDEIVSAPGAAELPRLEAAVADPVPGTDGSLAVVTAPATVASVGEDRRAEPRALVHETDFDEAARFGGDPSATGFAGAPDEPGRGEVVLGEDLAREIGAGVGDTVEVFAYGTSLELEVTGMLPRLGVAGYYPLPGSRSPVAFVEPGTLAAMAEGADDAQPPTAQLLVSNDGGVFDGVDGSDRVADELRRRLELRPGVQVDTGKADILEEAEREGDTFTQLFTSVGGFSVIAGILLLVNIFVMLAEERKTELGTLRALGFKRSHLVRSFGMEGAVYAVLASVAGALAGVAVGRVIVFVTRGLFDRGEFGLVLRFEATPGSLLTGGLAGLAIGLLTVWGTSVRIGRLNVIRAIRDVPEPVGRRQRFLTLVVAAVGVAAGGLLFRSGVDGEEPFSTLAGPAIALACSVPLLSSLLPRRVAVSLPAALALAWGALAFGRYPDVFGSSDVSLFLVQGVVLVGSAVALVTSNVDIAASVARRGVASRLGLAYPLAKRARTALLLGMYSLVIFTLTVLAVIADIFAAQAPSLTEETRAGYDLLVDSSPGNPVTERQLLAQPGVVAASGLARGFPEFAAEITGGEPTAWPLSGFDETLLERGVPVLEERDPAYASDEAAWRAVLADSSLGLVSGFFLAEEAGPPQDDFDPGDSFSVINSTTRTAQPVRVAGIVRSDFQFNGVLMRKDFVEGFLGPLASPTRWYVAVEDGANPDEVADRLTADLLAYGVDAQSFRDVVDEQLSEQNGFLRLLEGFLALGLVIGIAGLGVVMVRAVRERRRQIGMLRAMGVRSDVVRRAFLVEATFIAAQGIVIGVALGLLTSWTLLENSDAFGDQRLDFVVPWLGLAGVVTGPLVASLLAAAVPASRAAAIRPAVALRIAD